MEMPKVEIEMPKDMKPFIVPQNSDIQQKRNALLLYPYIENNTISHGKAAEILGMHKLELVDLYAKLGLSYFDMDIDEVEEDMETIKRLRGSVR